MKHVIDDFSNCQIEQEKYNQKNRKISAQGPIFSYRSEIKSVCPTTTKKRRWPNIENAIVCSMRTNDEFTKKNRHSKCGKSIE